MSDCLFCRVVAHELPATFVLENDQVVAIRDINPQAPVHVLVLPRDHVRSVAELTAHHGDLWLALLSAAQQVARDEGLEEPGFRLVANVGRDGGQTVDHLHLHILGGRQMTWPPG